MAFIKCSKYSQNISSGLCRLSFQIDTFMFILNFKDGVVIRVDSIFKTFNKAFKNSKLNSVEVFFDKTVQFYEKKSRKNEPKNNEFFCSFLAHVHIL